MHTYIQVTSRYVDSETSTCVLYLYRWRYKCIHKKLVRYCSVTPFFSSPPQEEDKGEDDKSTQVRVETDISGLSKAKKMQLLKRESPEFLPLVEDMKSKSGGSPFQILRGLLFCFI